MLPRLSSTTQAGGGSFELAYSQPTCPICLDDYVPGKSMVRELPCRHIYHPECIDSFLLETSCLCPVCKKLVLPPGYCPKTITDNMVRQERVSRRPRHDRERRNGENRRSATSPPLSPLAPRSSEQYMSAISVHNAGLRRLGQVVLRNSLSSRPPEPASQESHTDLAERQQALRRRAIVMLGDQHAEDDTPIPACEDFVAQVPLLTQIIREEVR